MNKRGNAWIVILTILVVIALGISIYSLFSGPKIDPKTCNVVYTGLNNPQTINCDDLCSSKTCLVALRRHSHQIGSEFHSQETLTDCSEVLQTGSFDDDGNIISDYSQHEGKIDDFSLNCLCC